MIERVYYTNPTCSEFTATVLSSWWLDGRPAVSLSRTAFYPTSGGQPCDAGTLGNRRVVDVVDLDDRVVHVLDGELAKGEVVTGVIDWVRRSDHMQQHSGQHVLSAAFDQLLSNPTVGFHMGIETSTIDLARDVSSADLVRVEDEANRIVWADRAIEIRFVSPDEAKRLPLRKEPGREGTLRLIDIEGVDLSACGGTHVRRTGEVGMVAITSFERFKGGARVGFVCGARALQSHRAQRAVVDESVKVLSVVPSGVPMAIERLQRDIKEYRKSVKELREALAVHEARVLLDGASQVGGVRVIVRECAGHDATTLKSMALELTAAPNVAVALFTSTNPTQVLVARSSGTQLDAAAILSELLRLYGGKGGGKSDLAQGGGLTGDLRQILWTASGLLEDACREPRLR